MYGLSHYTSRWQQKVLVERHPPGNEIYRDSKLAMFEVSLLVRQTEPINDCNVRTDNGSVT